MANTEHRIVPVIVTSGSSVHAGIDRGDGYGPSVDCGAVRYRNITTRTIQPVLDAEITCVKCLRKLAKTAAQCGITTGQPVVEAAPVVEAPATTGTRKPSHGNCDHAQTPAARKACRRARKAAAGL